jgi:hypothetical protein
MIDNELPKAATQKENVAAFLYFSSIYFVSVGVLFLWGYWSTFHINILEYLSLADIIKSTAIPIASAFCFLALGIITGELTSPKSLFPRGGGANTKPAVFVRKHLPFFAYAYIVATFAFIYLAPIRVWLVAPFFVAIPVTLAMFKLKFLSTAIPHESTRTIILFMVATLPVFAFGHGRVSSHEILDGIAYDYVVSPVENVSIPLNAVPMQRLRYLGHADDVLFFWDPVKSATVVTKFDAPNSLILKRYTITKLVSASVQPKPASTLPAQPEKTSVTKPALVPKQ